MIALWCMALAHAGAIEEGAAALQAGRLEEAIEAWSAPRGAGRRASGILEYDLGTAWLLQGDAPRAIAHLRASARLRPRDGSVHHNLALARSELSMVPPAAAASTPWTAVVTPGELGFLGLLLSALGSVALVAERFRRAARPVGGASLRRFGRGGVAWLPGRVAGAMLLGCGLAITGVALRGAVVQQAHPIAVVVDGEAVLRDAASVNAGERFRLPPGAEVWVDRSYDGFLLIADGRGRRGWLAAGAAEVGW